MSALRVHLFGKLCVERGDQALVGLDARRVQELLVYLLLYRDHPHHRERLADVMWGEGTSAQVRKGLRQALWKLQSVLGGAGEPAEPSVLHVDPDYVQLNAAADVWVDAAVFELAYARVQGSPGAALDAASAGALRAAVALYHGDLLDGWYQDWCLFERERYQHMYLEMLAKLMGHAEAHGDYDAGVDYGTRILRYDRARERTHRALMRLYYLAGDRVESLRQYDRCVAALAEEIGVAPARRTVALCEQVRADKWEPTDTKAPRFPPPAERAARPVDSVAGRAAAPNGHAAPNRHAAPDGHTRAPNVDEPSVNPPAVTLDDLLGHLWSLRSALTEIERRVDQEIDAVARVLGR